MDSGAEDISGVTLVIGIGGWMRLTVLILKICWEIPLCVLGRIYNAQRHEHIGEYSVIVSAEQQYQSMPHMLHAEKQILGIVNARHASKISLCFDNFKRES